MRYIANDSGYVQEVSFGADIQCNGSDCTEYTGGVPSGFDSLIDWFIKEGDKLYRWKIENKQLTLDDSVPVKSAPGVFPSVYTKLKDIGLTTFPTTMKTVADAMPKNSMLMLDSRDILADGTTEISDLGVTGAGMYMFFRGNTSARLSLLHIYGGVTATTGFMNYGCYASTDDRVVWVRGERQNNTYPDCRYRTAADGSIEWINPPMLAGNEYRTTERWNGKIVYKKLLTWKSTTDMNYVGTYNVPHGISSLDLPSLRIEWTTNGWALPYVNGNESLHIAQYDSTNLVIKTDGNALWDAGRTFYFTMKYCKD